MEPSWDDLRIFLALAREGTLTTAAKALGVSHPTVARRVQALERQIGARLFERLPDRFVPTSAGEKLLDDTEAMERAALAINRRSASLGDTVSGVVRLRRRSCLHAWPGLAAGSAGGCSPGGAWQQLAGPVRGGARWRGLRGAAVLSRRSRYEPAAGGRCHCRRLRRPMAAGPSRSA